MSGMLFWRGVGVLSTYFLGIGATELSGPDQTLPKSTSSLGRLRYTHESYKSYDKLSGKNIPSPTRIERGPPPM